MSVSVRVGLLPDGVHDSELDDVAVDVFDAVGGRVTEVKVDVKVGLGNVAVMLRLMLSALELREFVRSFVIEVLPEGEWDNVGVRA